MARPKKTIVAKKETQIVQNENLKKRVKRVKLQAKENVPMKEQLEQEKKTLIKKTPTKKVKKNKDDVLLSIKEYEQLLNNDMRFLVEKNKKYIEEIYKLKSQLQVANMKFRTKYMQLVHEKQCFQETKSRLMDVVLKLRVELIKYAPENELYEVADTITRISNEKHIATKKSLKMPE